MKYCKDCVYFLVNFSCCTFKIRGLNQVTGTEEVNEKYECFENNKNNDCDAFKLKKNWWDFFKKKEIKKNLPETIYGSLEGALSIPEYKTTETAKIVR